MSAQGDIVFMIGADVTGLTSAGNMGERSLADMEKAAKALERQLGKIGEAGAAFQRDLNQLAGVTTAFGKSARDSAAAFEAFDRSRAQVDNLRASIDPLFAASKRYEAALMQLDAALEMGTISAREHSKMLEMLSASYLRADGAASSMGGGVGFLGNMTDGARSKIQQVGFQVQDFAVQVGAGTSATQAFAQQFPQLAGAFGPVGVAVGTLAAIGIPLLAAAFANASTESDKLAAAADRQKLMMDALSEATARLRLERELASSGRSLKKNSGR
jgi:chromosome segregation ATPase